MFTTPTLDECRAYAAKMRLAMDVSHFHDHYTSNGWKISGRAPMKDWRAAARNWMRSDSFGPGGGAVPAKKEVAAPAQDGAYPVVLSPEERWGAKKGES